MTAYEINILKTALMEVERNEVKMLKSLPQEEANFSDAFKNKIQKIDRMTKSVAWRMTRTVPRRIAVAFIAAIITFCLMMSISAAIRSSVVKFCVNVYEEFITIFIKNEDEAPEGNEEIHIPQSIENVYLPTYIPENYYQTPYVLSNTSVETIWIGENSVLILSQDILKTSFKSYVDNKCTDYTKTNFGEIEIYYMVKNGQRFIVWTYDYYLFSAICPDDLEFEEIEKVIKSLTVQNNQP